MGVRLAVREQRPVGGKTNPQRRRYFLAEARYRGELTKENPWTGKVAWSKKLAAKDRQWVLGLLKLPESTGPAEWWLTKFEDPWPYKKAAADLYFSLDANQRTVERQPIIHYVSSPWPSDITAYALVAFVAVPPLLRRYRNRRRRSSIGASDHGGQ